MNPFFAKHCWRHSRLYVKHKARPRDEAVQNYNYSNKPLFVSRHYWWTFDIVRRWLEVESKQSTQSWLAKAIQMVAVSTETEHRRLNKEQVKIELWQNKQHHLELWQNMPHHPLLDWQQERTRKQKPETLTTLYIRMWVTDGWHEVWKLLTLGDRLV